MVGFKDVDVPSMVLVMWVCVTLALQQKLSLTCGKRSDPPVENGLIPQFTLWERICSNSPETCSAASQCSM